MLILIRGAGDLATGIALRLYRSGFKVVMTEIAKPTTIRRTVAFSEVVHTKETTVENIKAKLAKDVSQANEFLETGVVPVLIDPDAKCIGSFKPDVVIDAIIAKRNLGTSKKDASIVIGIGPGFEADKDCHAVIETKRGHNLGRVLYKGCAAPNTHTPGNIEGFSFERLIRAPKDGIFKPVSKITDMVESQQVVGYVEDKPVTCNIKGVVRGLISENLQVKKGQKIGDVDPRGNIDFCFTSSDKALAIGGGVIEAILHFHNQH